MYLVLSHDSKQKFQRLLFCWGPNIASQSHKVFLVACCCVAFCCVAFCCVAFCCIAFCFVGFCCVACCCVAFCCVSVRCVEFGCVACCCVGLHGPRMMRECIACAIHQHSLSTYSHVSTPLGPWCFPLHGVYIESKFGVAEVRGGDSSIQLNFEFSKY